MFAISKEKTYPDNPAASIQDLIQLLKLETNEEYNQEIDYLNSVLFGASEYAVNYLGRSLITQIWIRQYTIEMPYTGLAVETKRLPVFYLTFPPVEKINLVVIRRGDEDITTTDYRSDLVSEPAVIELKRGLVNGDKVYIEYEAGYGDTHYSVPESIRRGILQHAAYLYNHRGDCDAEEAAVKSGAKDIYKSWRISPI